MTPAQFRQPWLILNPRAASGKAKRHWERLRPLVARALGDVTARFTEAPGHATELTREALASGADLVVATGGDGTLNEVVNGFFAEGKPLRPEASAALIPFGTGGDFRRSAGLPDSPAAAVAAIADARPRRIDAAKLRLADARGQSLERYFLNVASFGLGGEVSVAAKRNFLTPYSGYAAFLWATVVTFLRFRAKTVRLELDGEPLAEPLAILQVSLGNGGYHGGGMQACPLAKLDSGSLEVTVIGKTGLLDFLRSLPLLYSGEVYSHPKCRHFRVQRVAARSDSPVLAEVDGEALGGLPLEAEILPGAISFAGLAPEL